MLVLDVRPSKYTIKMLRSGSFFKERKDVLIITRDELRTYLPDELLSRRL